MLGSVFHPRPRRSPARFLAAPTGCDAQPDAPHPPFPPPLPSFWPDHYPHPHCCVCAADLPPHPLAGDARLDPCRALRPQHLRRVDGAPTRLRPLACCTLASCMHRSGRNAIHSTRAPTALTAWPVATPLAAGHTRQQALAPLKQRARTTCRRLHLKLESGTPRPKPCPRTHPLHAQACYLALHEPPCSAPPSIHLIPAALPPFPRTPTARGLC